MRRAISVLLVLLLVLAAREAAADVTLFAGKTANPSSRAARGVSVDAILLLVGFEFEYSDTAEDVSAGAPAPLRTGMFNAFVQTPSLVGLRFYATAGGGLYQERLTSTGYKHTIGGWQHPEKAVPLFTINALLNKPLPIYGRGEQRRDRLHVDDHSRAVLTVLERGELGSVYNVAAGNNRDNLTVARAILERLDRPETLIRFVEDRPGHDWDYIMDASRLRDLGWKLEHDFRSALDRTIDWYVEHRDWWEPIVSGEFQQYYDRQYGRRLATSEAYRP